MKSILQIAILACTSNLIFAQTNPTPWNFNTLGNYSFNSLAPNASAFPASMAIHQMNTSPPTLASTAVSNIPLPLSAANSTAATNVYGYNAKGMGLRASPTQTSSGYMAGKLGEVVVAVNTTSRTSVKVSFKTGSIGEGGGVNNAIFKLRCQYRVGTSGSWSEMPGGTIEYQSKATEDSVSYGPITLPATVDDQPVVQVRWVHYWVSGTFTANNNRSFRCRLDDISITSLPIVTFPAIAEVCSSVSAFTLNSATPSGGTYSGTGVSSGQFSPSVAGAGVFPITYLYTDAFGISNSAVSSVTVNASPSVSVNSGAICLGGSFTMTPSGAISYVYSNGSAVVSPIANATYTVTGTGSNGCSNTAVSSVTVNDLPSVSVNSGASCLGGSFTMTPSGAISYVYSSGSAVVSPITNTTYTVTGTDNNGCTNTAVSSVTVNNCVALTQLTTAFCNTTLTVLDASVRLYCNPVANATNYEWQFTDVSTGNVVFTKQRGWQWSDFYLTGYWPSVQYNKTYSVKVRAYVGGIWGNYGNACTVTTPTTPSASMVNTQLTSAYCNQTLSSLTSDTKIYCNPVQGATDYEWQFSNPTTGIVLFTKRRLAQWTDFYLKGYWTAIQLNRTYNVKIRAYVNGAWSEFGNVCTLTTPSGLARLGSFEDEEIEEFDNIADVVAYPNPSNGIYNLNVSIDSKITIMDVLGKVVYSEQLNAGSYVVDISQYANGLYILKTENIYSAKAQNLIKE